jgi:hypothetical protein
MWLAHGMGLYESLNAPVAPTRQKQTKTNQHTPSNCTILLDPKKKAVYKKQKMNSIVAHDTQTLHF